MRRVLVAIPALNEAATVAGVIQEVKSALPHADVVVVDDGSTDETAALAAAAGAEVLQLPFNVGVGGALRTAFLFAAVRGYDVVLQIDADGQHDPVQAKRLMDELDHASVVVGSRFLGGGEYPVTRLRKLSMRGVSRLVSLATGTRVTDATSGYRVADRDAIELFAQHYPAEYLGDTVESLVLAHRAGLSIAETAVDMQPRRGGEASQGPVRSGLYLLRALLAVFSAITGPLPRRADA